MKFIILISLLAAVSAASVGTDHCTWGPAYWCDHPVKAKECGTGATKFCIKNDWSRLTVDDDTTCEDCETFIKDVQDVLNSSEVQTEVIDLIKELCNKLGSEATTCKLVVDLYGKDFLEELVSDLDPTKVCLLLDLCRSKTTTNAKEVSLLLPQVLADPCSDCEQIFSDLKDLLSNKSVQQFVFQEAIMFCKEAGVPEELCKDYIDQYGPQVFKYILGLLDGDKLCKFLGVCNGQMQYIFSRKPVSRPNADPCSDCKQIFADLDDILSNKSVQQFIFQEVIMLCTEEGLPQDLCKKYIDQYGPQVFNYIIQLLDGDKICALVGVCKGQVQSLFPKVSGPNTDACTYCKQIFSDLDDLLDNSTVQQLVGKALSQLCQELGLPEAVCQDIPQYLPEVFSYLAGLLDPDMICQELGICSGSASPGFHNLIKSVIVNKVFRANADACTECKQIFSDIDDLLKNSSVQQEVINLLTQLCEELQLPEAVCQGITQYVPEALSYLAGVLDPIMICQDLGVCSGNAAPDFHSLIRHVIACKVSGPNTDVCSDCKQIFSDVDNILNNSTFQQSVDKRLIQLCKDLGLPGQICDQIPQYVTEVLSYIAGLLDPNTVCKGLGICSGNGASSFHSLIRHVMASKVSGPNTGVCANCKQIFSDLDDVLNNSTFQQFMGKELSQICMQYHLPEDFCNELPQFIPEAFSYIAGLLDPNMICQELGLCSGNAALNLHSLIERAFINKVSRPNADACSDCKQIFNDVDSLLLNATVQQFILKEAVMLCVDLGLPEDQCKTYIDQYGPIVFNYVVQLLDPDTVCQFLGVCPGDAAPDFVSLIKRAYKVSRPNADACSDCKQIFNDVDSLLLNTTVQQFIFKEAVMLCVDLGLPEDQCKTYIDQYGPIVFNYLVQFLDPDTVCQFLGVCPGNAAPDFKSLIRHTYKVPKVGGDLCADCKQAISDIRDMLSNKTLQQEVFKIAIEVCELTGLSESDCKSYVQQYGTEIFNELIQFLDPNMICSELGVCSSPSVELPTFVQDAKVPPANGDVCTECKQFFVDLSDILNNKTIQTDLLNKVTAVCKALRFSASSCDEISTYGPIIIEFLASNLNGSSICVQQQICGATMVKMSRTLSLFKKISENDGDVCAECKQMFTYASDILKNKTVQSNILEEAVDVCVAIGGPSTSATCNSTVNKYGPVILEAIIGYLTPDLCTSVKLCGAGQNSVQLVPVMPALELVPARPVVAASQNETTCLICSMLMEILSTYYPEGATSVKLESKMYDICTQQPFETLVKECTAFVTNYADRLIKQLIANKFNYGQVCTQVGVCHKENKMHLKQQVFAETYIRKGENETDCLICNMLMDTLAGLYPKGATSAELETKMYDLCKEIPIETIEKMCNAFVTNWADRLIKQLIADKFDYSEVCSQLGICTEVNKMHLKQQVFAETYIRKGQNETTCLICSMLMEILSTYYPEGATSAKLESKMYDICTQQPFETLVKECTAFVTNYADRLIKQLIANKFNYGQVCTQVGVCHKENKVPLKLQVFAETYMLTGENKTKCLMCDVLMDIVAGIYPNGAPRAKFEDKLYDICNSLPNVTIVRECNAFVLKYGDQIYNQVTADKLDYSKVCIQLEICPKDAVAVPKGRFNYKCVICQFQMDYLAVYLPKSYTKEEIEENLEKACAFLPIDFLISCKNYTAKYKDQIVKLLMDKTPFENVCEQLKSCSESENKVPLKLQVFAETYVRTGQNKTTCLICGLLMDSLARVYPKGATSPKLVREMYYFCKQIPDETVRNECNNFVSNWRYRIIDQLRVDKFDYTEVCAQLGVCPKDAVAAPKADSEYDCLMCQYLMDFLARYPPKNYTKTEVENDMEKACSYLPGNFQSPCKSFMRQYVDQIVKLLIDKVPFDSVCRQLNVCSKSDVVLAQSDFGDIFECFTCIFVKSYLVEEIKPNVTKQQVNAALDAVCILIAMDVTECQAFIKKYRSNITRYLLSGKPVDDMCKELDICSSDKKPVATPVDTQVENSAECILCEFIMDKLDDILKKNATEKDIIEALDKVCSLLPHTLTEECDKFVAEYIDAIVQVILAVGPQGACEALGFCADVAAVPPPIKASVGDSIECEICKLVMKELAVILEKNATKEDIENFLDHICAILPSKYKAECDSFVAQYTPEILMLLEEMMTTDEICELLKLCTESKGSSPVAIPAPKKTPVGNSIECEVCDLVMKELQVLLEKNVTKQDIEHFLENVCDILPSTLKTECDKFIAEYVDDIIALLESVSPDKICQLLGLCASTDELAEVGESLGCILCKFIMKEVDKELAGKKSEAEIEKVLEEVCSLMPAAIRTECEDFVKEYAPQIIQLLLEFVSPDKVCDELKLCTSAEPVLMKVPEKLGGIACGPCEMIVGQVEMILKEGSTEKEIEDFLKKEVCSKLQGEAKTACLDVVDKYLPEILQLVTSMTPEELCGLLGLCSTEKELEEKAEAELDSTAECMICELIVKELRSGLSQNATEAEIQKFLGMVCSKIPLSEFAKDCEEFVDDYTKPIIQYLLAKMDPDKICEALKVCTPSKLGAVNKVQDDPLCLVCDVILGMIEAQLEKNKSVEEVTKFIEKVCTILPDPLNQQCKAFLDIYGPVLLKLLINSELSPPDICKDLRLCTSTVKLTFTSSADDCTFCKELVKFLEDLLQDHEDEILKEIAKLCGLLPEADQKECENYIEVYGATIIDLLLEDFFSPEEVCKDLKYCNSSLTDMLPADRCKLGPTFWCASMNNAKLCHAVEHCRRHAWN